MTTISPDSKKIATVSVILVIAIYALSHYIFDTPPNFIILKMGIIISLVGLFWIYFDKAGWRQRIFRLWGWMCDNPNLNGRYEGTVSRFDENNPHKFVLEIKQTFRHISINTYSKNSIGRSITANLVQDGVGKFCIFCTWHCRTKNRVNPLIKEDFYGTSIIQISGSKGNFELQDEYFTRRNPPTQGETKLAFISKKLKHRYE